MQRILAIADDLSGAAETAAALLEASFLMKSCAQSAQSGSPIPGTADDGAPRVYLLPRLHEDLWSALERVTADGSLLVLDTDNRAFSAEAAATHAAQPMAGKVGSMRPQTVPAPPPAAAAAISSRP